MSRISKYKITLDQLRLAARVSIISTSIFSRRSNLMMRLVYQSEKKSKRNPCGLQMERILNSFEAVDFQIRPIYKYVKELEDCIKSNLAEYKKKGRASTLYYLNRYVDQKKHKQK